MYNPLNKPHSELIESYCAAFFYSLQQFIPGNTTFFRRTVNVSRLGRLMAALLAITTAITLIGCELPFGDAGHDEMRISPGAAGTRIAMLERAAQYAGGSGVVVRGGKIIYEWGDTKKLYDLKSTTKSIGAMALGLAVGEGRVKLHDPVRQHYPDFGRSSAKPINEKWLRKVTFFQLATHTAGFDKPGGYVKMIHAPGTAWAYSDAGPNWLADALTHLYQKDMWDLLAQELFEPIGISRKDLKWRENAYRNKKLGKVRRREFGSGIHANVVAMGRIGTLLLEEGYWGRRGTRQILPSSFVSAVRRPDASIAELPVVNDIEKKYADAPKHYGLLWWNNQDQSMVNVPRDAYWSWGLHDSIIAIIPSLDLVFARAGDTIKGIREPNYYQIFEPLFDAVVGAVNHGAPYPNSPIIANLRWADKNTIKRQAKGGDNWPVTWAADDDLYTAYGDGHGFKPRVERKLSLGFAKVEGTPPGFRGVNIRSIHEQIGQGKTGKKASGILGVDGKLYMWARNADNNGNGSQLAWSVDYGKTWEWSDWVFDQFGYCTFINFGRDYKGARDGYIYSVSHNESSAYERADTFILMRVAKNRLADRSEYEFFKQLAADGSPVWTRDISKIGAVFEDPGHCHRSGITYNSVLKRYIWWQLKSEPGVDGRFESRSFGVFDAPETWGPWTTAFYTTNWDVTTGETGSFPTKWMDSDGKSMHLVFSGNDAFSVRKATVALIPGQH